MPVSLITGVIRPNISFYAFFFFFLAVLSMFFLKCTNCNLKYAIGKLAFRNSDGEFYLTRHFPSFYCSRCGQNHCHPCDPPNEDYKKEGFDVNEFIKAKKKKKLKPK